jgi:peptidoglycan hydrolase CwlO-like protein
VIEKFKRTLEMNKYLSGLCVVSFFYFSSIGYVYSAGPNNVQVSIDPRNSKRGSIPVITNADEIEASDFSKWDLQKMQDSLRKIESDNRKVDELTEKVLQLERKNSAQESKIERLQKSLDDMKRSNDNLSNQVSNLSGKIK